MSKVIQDLNQEAVPAEIIAQSIKKMADGMRRLRSSGLSDRAIKALIKDASGCSMREINDVLFALDNLEKFYLKKKIKS